jgi:hypothetical protein
MKIPPTWSVVTTRRASAALVTPTISSWASLSRIGIVVSNDAGTPQVSGGGVAVGVIA